MSDTEHEYFDDFYECDGCQSRHRVGVECPLRNPQQLQSALAAAQSRVAELENLVMQHTSYVFRGVSISLHEPSNRWYPLSLEYRLGSKQVGFDSPFAAIEYVKDNFDKVMEIADQ